MPPKKGGNKAGGTKTKTTKLSTKDKDAEETQESTPISAEPSEQPFVTDPPPLRQDFGGWGPQLTRSPKGDAWGPLGTIDSLGNMGDWDVPKSPPPAPMAAPPINARDFASRPAKSPGKSKLRFDIVPDEEPAPEIDPPPPTSPVDPHKTPVMKGPPPITSAWKGWPNQDSNAVGHLPEAKSQNASSVNLGQSQTSEAFSPKGSTLQFNSYGDSGPPNSPPGTFLHPNNHIGSPNGFGAMGGEPVGLDFGRLHQAPGTPLGGPTGGLAHAFNFDLHGPPSRRKNNDRFEEDAPPPVVQLSPAPQEQPQLNHPEMNQPPKPSSPIAGFLRSHLHRDKDDKKSKSKSKKNQHEEEQPPPTSTGWGGDGAGGPEPHPAPTDFSWNGNGVTAAPAFTHTSPNVKRSSIRGRGKDRDQSNAGDTWYTNAMPMPGSGQPEIEEVEEDQEVHEDEEAAWGGVGLGPGGGGNKSQFGLGGGWGPPPSSPPIADVGRGGPGLSGWDAHSNHPAAGPRIAAAGAPPPAPTASPGTPPRTVKWGVNETHTLSVAPSESNFNSISAGSAKTRFGGGSFSFTGDPVDEPPPPVQDFHPPPRESSSSPETARKSTEKRIWGRKKTKKESIDMTEHAPPPPMPISMPAHEPAPAAFGHKAIPSWDQGADPGVGLGSGPPRGFAGIGGGGFGGPGGPGGGLGGHIRTGGAGGMGPFGGSTGSLGRPGGHGGMPGAFGGSLASLGGPGNMGGFGGGLGGQNGFGGGRDEGRQEDGDGWDDGPIRIGPGSGPSRGGGWDIEEEEVREEHYGDGGWDEGGGGGGGGNVGWDDPQQHDPQVPPPWGFKVNNSHQPPAPPQPTEFGGLPGGGGGGFGSFGGMFGAKASSTLGGRSGDAGNTRDGRLGRPTTVTHAAPAPRSSVSAGFVDSGLDPKPPSEVRIAGSGGKGLEAAQRALFGVHRVAENRFVWNLPYQHDPRVIWMNEFIERFNYAIAIYGFNKYIRTREKGALITNVDYAPEKNNEEPAFDWISFPEAQRTRDRTFQRSIAANNPAKVCMVFMVLTSKSGNSIGIWRRRIAVPEKYQSDYRKQIRAIEDDLRDKVYTVKVDPPMSSLTLDDTHMKPRPLPESAIVSITAPTTSSLISPSSPLRTKPKATKVKEKKKKKTGLAAWISWGDPKSNRIKKKKKERRRDNDSETESESEDDDDDDIEEDE